jgi:magnesium-transporting ATPase (P-type)
MVSITVVVSLAEGLAVVDILPLALVLLMSAVPVALLVMFTVSMAIDSIELARRGVLVTRLSAAEDAANMDVLCADKTGTLTMNRLSLACVLPQAGFTDVFQDLRSQTPAGPFDLVPCRYLAFTYFAWPLQEQTLAHILAQLLPNGYLVIGTHERMPGRDFALTPLVGTPQILQNAAKLQ